MRVTSCLALLPVAVILGGCVTQSGGLALGMKGSPAWNKTAPQVDIDRYYNAMATYELCIEWAEKWDWSGPRRNIARALERRGEDPMKCNDPAEDSRRRAAATAAAAAAAANKQSRELKDLQRKVDDIESSRRTACILAGGVMVGSSCL